MKFFRYILFFLYIGLFNYAYGGHMETAAPVVDFHLPMFGESGYKIWDLRGKEGFIHDENHVDVHGMQLCTYCGEDTCEVDTVIESLKATLMPKENQAYGDELIFVIGRNFNILGKGWVWNGNLKKIQIEKEVRVTFNQSLISFT